MGRGKGTYDPVRLAEAVRRAVSGRNVYGEECRKYFRFRGGRWYGGIATGDVIGCNLRCAFCWSWYFRDSYERGVMLSPEGAVSKLARIALRRGYRQVRLSGGEPTLTRDHLIRLAKLCTSRGFRFVLETNGILLGHSREYAEEVAEIEGIVVRVSFKGVTPQEFRRLTGASEEYFEMQFNAIRNLIRAGLEPGREVFAAAMISFSRDEDIARFVLRLTEIDERLADVDWEVIFLYPHVKEVLAKNGLKPRRYVLPDRIPDSMV